MATTSNLRLRRSEAQLHALAGVEREIRINDPNGRRKYLQDFSQAFRSYESVIDRQQLNAERTRVPTSFSSATIMRCLQRSVLPQLCSKNAPNPETGQLCWASKQFSPATSTSSTNGGGARLMRKNCSNAFASISIGAMTGRRFTNCW